VVFAKGYLGHLDRQIQAAGQSVLPVVLVFLLFPEVFAQAVCLPIWIKHQRHSCIGRYLSRVCVQHRHHNRWRFVISDAGVGPFLLHESHLEILR